MKYLSLFVLAGFMIACQITPFQTENDGPAITPDLNARVARILRTGGQDGKTVMTEESFEYNITGQLLKRNTRSRTANNQLELVSYDEYLYDDQNKPKQKLSYYRNQSGTFVVNLWTNYEQLSANTIRETQYYQDYITKALTAQNRTEITTEQGRKIRTVQYYLNGTSFTKGNEVVFQYQDGRLVAEQTLNSNGVSGSVLRYTYKGQTATIEEFLGTRPESISEQKNTYDSRGRLARQEVLKTNPLLCVAMFPGSATIYEYVD
jgi:hypothetical protein